MEDRKELALHRADIRMIMWTCGVNKKVPKVPTWIPQTVGIHVKNFWPGHGGGVNAEKVFLSSSLITMQNLLAVSHTMNTHVGGPKIWGLVGDRPLRIGRGWPPRKTSSSTHHHAKLGCSRLNGTYQNHWEKWASF